MSTCPYATHSTPKQVVWNQLPVSYCREGCQRTFLFCSHCKQANRPLSHHCRSCGKPVSFESNELAFENQFSIDDFNEQKYSYSLTNYGIGEVRVLKSYQGYLFVVGEIGLLVFDVHSLAEPLAGPLRSPLGGEFLGVSVYRESDDEVLLVTTATGVFQMSLLDLTLPTERPTLESVYVSQPSRFVSHEAVALAGRVYVLEHDNYRSKSWLTCIPDGLVTEFEQISRPPVAVVGDRLFFFTERTAFLYECKTGKLIEAKSSDPLADRPPAYDVDANTIFMVGEAKLWRMELSAEAPPLAPLATPNPLRGVSSIAARANRLFVAHLGGMTILDMFGTKKWDSLYQAASDGLPPQVYGNLFTLTLPGPRFGRIVRIHQIDNPDKSKDLLVTDASLLCPPLFALDRMFVAAGDQLSVYDFRSRGERAGASGL